ncbi:MAG: hypothetical protein WC279_12930 [Sulfurimonas sp.]|jgi:hypothetical protein|uniref:hypothetical protein n=1 Tax=Sulfurimonas sp. TaxID=2022749 RepID=UPI003567FC93
MNRDIALAMMQNPEYLKKRESTGRELKGLLLPLALTALAAAGVYKGVKYARGVTPLADETVAGTRAIFDDLGKRGRQADRDIMFQLNKKLEQAFKGASNV